MFSETSCSVLFSCKMRKFVTRQPCWDLLRKYQAPPTSRSTANRELIRNALSEMTCDWLKVSRHRLDFLKPENRAMRRCRSLVFSQNTWITICWKVIMEFSAQWCQNNSAYWRFNVQMVQTLTFILELTAYLTELRPLNKLKCYQLLFRGSTQKRGQKSILQFNGLISYISGIITYEGQ